VMLVRSAQGEVTAFASLLPEYQLKQVSIDLMRHIRDIESGSMDFLFAALLQWAKDNQYETFSLGMSALSGIGEKPQDPAIERTLHYIFEHVSQFYNFKGLHSFKEKFHPIWSPRYLIHPGPASLPLVAIALMRADSGDNLLEEFFNPQ
jgi:phosphatidylglycerol lysyltransferase